MPAVRLDDGLHQAQAEAEAAFGAARVAAEQALEDPRQLVEPDPGAGVADRHARPVLVAADLDVDAAPAGVYFTALSIRLAATCSMRVAIRLDHDVVDRIGRREDHPLRLGHVADRGRPRAATTAERETRSRRSCMAPLSASEMSISVSSITSTRSDSSTQSASALR